MPGDTHGCIEPTQPFIQTLILSPSHLTVGDYSGRCHKKSYHSNKTSEAFFIVESEDTNCSSPLSEDCHLAVSFLTMCVLLNGVVNVFRITSHLFK